MWKWRRELKSCPVSGAPGIYYERLLPGGFVSPEDQEPNIEGLEFYFDAFRELGTCRPGGMDLQAIPFTAIADYSRIYGIEDFDEFAWIIRFMDDCLLELNQQANAAEKEKREKTDGKHVATKTN